MTSVGLSWAAVDGKLSGAFTVNADGDQVYFSQGNLQYQASTNTWRFAEHQYDFIGDAAGNNTESDRNTQSDWIDLFGWATSGNSASGTAYQPWQSSTTDSEYGPAITSGQWTYANSDWGINPISNGGNVANSWRTLTQAEWDYILNGRATDYRFCYAKLTIGYGLGYGLIILPDDWNPSYYALSAGSMNQGNHSYDSNEITAEDWTNSLEAHGAVFLPVTCMRYNGNAVIGLDDDKIGLYWSSIAAERHEVIENPEEDPMNIDIVNAAYNLAFNGGYYIRANQVTTRSRGLAVRLVAATPGGSTPANVCGDGLTWELSEGVLTISYDGVGTGEMYDFDYEYDPNPVNVAPWKENKSAITTVIVGNGVKSIGNYAFNDLSENFTAVTIANSVERIGVFAFTNSEEITEITLPSSLKTIDERGFANCGFTSITIPSGVTSIGYQAFSYCRDLTSLTCEATTPPALASSVFYKITNTSNIPLYVPSGSVTAYEAAAQWNAFNIQGYDPAPTPTPAPSVTAARFVYNYDCQRNPAFPQVNNACTLSGFKDPYEGYKGTRNGNIALGPWKLEFVAYYTPSNNYGCASQVNEAVYEYYNDLSGEEREAKKLEMPIFRLWQYNLTAQEFQPAAYGIVCAYAGEANAQDHAALFISSNSYGCFLSGHQHTTSFALTCENDLTTGLAALVDAASASSDPYYDVVWPVIVSIDAIGPVELSEHCKYYIEGSRAAYNALTDEQKTQVTNYSTLTDAETQWEALAAAAQPYADDVIALINAIPNPVVYTQDCKDAIDAAQAAYDALTDGQKMLVTNAETLLQAPIAFISAAPYVHILFTANNQERKVENVTLPREFTEAEMRTMLKELYGVEGDYDMYANSNADAVNISGGDWTIYPFMGEVNVNVVLEKWDPDYEWFDFSLEISLELPPLDPTPTPSTPETSDNVDGIEEYIESLNGNTTDLIINRTMYKDGYFNTLCLPFSMNASEIAASCLAGCELFEFESATANGGGLDLYIAEADAIVAGKPYLIRWASGENLTSLSFTGVTITASTGQAVGEGVQFVGTIGRTQLENGNENHLFLGANNTLYWPNTNNKLKGFRAYFLVSGSVAPHGAPARVVVRPKTPTAIENANVNAKAVKLLREGQLFIIKNGVKYNAQGQIVK